MDYKELLQKIYEKSEELAAARAALLFLKYLFEEEDDKRLLLDEKQFQMIMKIAGIPVEKDLEGITFDNDPSEVAYEAK